METYGHLPYLPNQIMGDTRKKDGWISGYLLGRFFEAKVYDIPSTFGINNGRVSKLAIGKSAMRDRNKDYFDQLDYNYDRGLDFSTIDPKLLDKIVKWLDALPRVFTDEEIEAEKQSYGG